MVSERLKRSLRLRRDLGNTRRTERGRLLANTASLQPSVFARTLTAESNWLGNLSKGRVRPVENRLLVECYLAMAERTALRNIDSSRVTASWARTFLAHQTPAVGRGRIRQRKVNRGVTDG